ncbi:PREDICTED: integrin alpha-PS3-like [Papilio xuthus]|uniref:Integrin alpha-PS3-like n=1 Tax=Papilio xuthus TaxID=66420 RepID=A0AAJ7EKH5_PAPXU|nr:PREDICTED: integrin alpha-PS3-like [Papilio xuthus]
MHTISLFIICIVINMVHGVLFHEPSSIEITPSENIENMAFGFSIGYQKSGKLVIGAPYSDLNGQVYTCAIEDMLKNNGVCKKVNIDVEGLTVNSTREDYPDRHYCLGASIIATDDYFLTCAPFWKSSYDKIEPGVTSSSYGTCFIYNETAYLYNGPYEQFIEHKINRHSFGNGLGWTSLYDQSNHLILLSKIFDRGYFSYISSEDPLKPSWSIENLGSTSRFQTMVNKFRYIGSALALGTFLFSGVNQTLYAFSMRTDDTYGKISFLRYKNKKLYLVPRISIDFEAINTMFGSAMLGVDINSDGYTELLVGAPAYYEDDAYETGALYIYIGGDLATIGSRNRTRLIVGNKVGARFGSAIASTDVDGDGFPEVIVSAPYEDFGNGAVYIIYGKELNKKCMKGNDFKTETMSLSQFVSTQRIQNEDFKSFGVTLQVINDIDNNGADELAVGCPESSRVILYRGIPSVEVTVSSQLVGDQVVRIKAKNFKVRVVIDTNIHEKPLNITGNLLIENSVVGDGVQIRDDQQLKTITLSRINTKYVIDVDVDISNDEPGTYKFTTSVKLDETMMVQNDVFDPSSVVIYPENPTSSLDIERRCSGESCLPQLNMTLEWSGSKTYKLGSTKSEEVIMRFKNYGNNSYVQTCVYLRIHGGRVGRNTCDEQDGTFKCLLPLPIKRNEEHILKLPIDMSSPSNDVNTLVFDVKFYNSSCVMQTQYQEKQLIVPLELDAEEIAVNGASRDRVITDSDVLDKSVETCENAHEYMIINNGSILWNNVRAIIKWGNQIFIKEYKIFQTSVTTDCDRQDTNKEVTYICVLTLEPNSIYKIIPSTIIMEEDVEKYRVGDTLNVTSSLELYLTPTETKKVFSLTTVIKYNKELSIGQNKPLIIAIAVIVALLILALVIYILRKISFFNRNTKKKLIQEKREDELRKSVKRPAPSGANDVTTSSGGTGVQNKAMTSTELPFKPECQDIDVCDEDNLITTREIEVH